MAGLQVDGLVSGLDTSQIIRQLLAIERNPQIRLQQRKTDINATVEAYRQLNTRFSGIREAADALSGSLDWAKRFATSSDESIVTATATGNAAVGTLSFNVDSLAATHAVVSSLSVNDTDTTQVANGDFTINGTTITAAEYGGGTLGEVVTAINDSDAGVSASAVQVSPGVYRLQISSKTNGADGVFTVDGAGLSAGMGSFGVVTQGKDAKITVGDGPGAYQVESTTNTFTDVLPGLTFTAHTLGAVSINVDRDGETLADNVQTLVDKMNDARSYIKTRNAYDAESGKKGIFLGQSLPREMQQALSNAAIDPVAGSSLVNANVGISTDRNGVISFDREKFLEAYASDPDEVEAFFTTNDPDDDADDGFAERISNMTTKFTEANTGRIAYAIESRENEISLLDDRIAGFDVRIEQREIMLRRQFATLERSLSALQSQGQWLAGQLGGLL